MVDLPSSDWTETSLIEAPALFDYTGSLTLGPGLCDPDQRRQFSPQTITGRAENWRMRNVTLVAPCSVVFKGTQEIEATRYCVYPNEKALMLKALEGPHQRLDGRSVFAGLNRVSANYFHIITQIIPAIAGYQLCPDFREGVLLLNAPSPTLLRGLQLAGVVMPEWLRFNQTAPIDVEDLTYSTYLVEANMLSRFSLAVFDRMIANAGIPEVSASSVERIIYVWRADTQAREMLNEDELVDRLVRDFNVEPVILSSLHLDQQIALFQSARVVVAPHGAGLANVVFCSPGAVLYELLPDHYINSAPNHLAQLRGLDYWCDVHRSEPASGRWRHQVPWTVDIEAVARRLAEIISTDRARPRQVTRQSVHDATLNPVNGP